VYHRSVIGTNSSSINILDVVVDELGGQVENVLSMLTMLGAIRSGDAIARSILDEVLMDLYRPIWGIPGSVVPTLDAVQRRLRLLGSTYKLQVVRNAAQEIAYNLSPYTEGSRADLFGKPTTVDFSLKRAVTVYDVSRLPLRELGGNLRTALLSIMVSDINTSIRAMRRAGDRVPIIEFVDEMGILMRDPVVAANVSAEYKTARARLTGMVMADQDLHSLLGPKDESGLHHGIPILANSAIRMIFTQKDDQRQIIKEQFPMLPTPMVDALPNLPRGTCILSLPGDTLLASIIPSRFDQIALSSRLQDREQARRLTAELMSEISGYSVPAITRAAETITA